MQDRLVLAIRTGLTIEEYWNLTPAEFYCYLKAYEQKELNSLNNSIIEAWYIEYFARQKKLEKVDKYLIKDKPKIKNKKIMSKEEIEEHYNKKVVK